MPQTHELSAAELARQIRAKKITPVEVAQSLLERMDALEPGPYARRVQQRIGGVGRSPDVPNSHGVADRGVGAPARVI